MRSRSSAGRRGHIGRRRAAPRDLAGARQILDGIGTHGQDYFVVRGYHGRPRRTTSGHEPFGDSFLDEFSRGDGPAYFARDLGGLRFVGLDTYEKRGRPLIVRNGSHRTRRCRRVGRKI
ncbi:hypothetical protein QF035_010178 [Streptomyces umbrinus]|uniref:Uncharacterized protein n=1 Tax=Streptomyces umbrinus TaxID=67370 RepID=A0ABU0T9W4_9ACTN|nr:hypothetical protein [Streptomyces umbrinus]MDQ1032596.1 hypothetical protein [Streptomyces umbrinus]